MKAESLKNYGRPYSETMTTLPEVVRKRVRREGTKVIRKHLVLLGLLRLLFLTWREKKRMLGINLDPIRRRGLANENFINFIIQRTAMFSATAKEVNKRGQRIARRLNYTTTHLTQKDESDHLMH